MPALPLLPPRPDGLTNPHLPVVIHPLSPSSTTIAATTIIANVVVRQQNPSPTPSQTFVVVPDSYGALDSSPSPGIVVAITLGSIAGFLLLIMLIYSILGFGPVAFWKPRTEVVEVRTHHPSRSVLSFRTRSERPPPPRKTKTRPVRATQMFQVRTRERIVERPARGAGGGGRRSPVVVEPPRRREPSPLTETETSVPTGLPSDYDEENEVVVIEENTPPRRKSSRRQAPGDRHRRSSSYRGSSNGDFDDRRKNRR